MSIEGLSINGQVKKYLYDSLDNKESIESRVTTLEEGWLTLKDEVIKGEIDTWLDDHPEATTTVQDGAITENKLAPASVVEGKINVNFLAKIKNAYVTPEMFGKSTDAQNVQTAFDSLASSGGTIVLDKLYEINASINILLQSDSKDANGRYKRISVIGLGENAGFDISSSYGFVGNSNDCGGLFFNNVKFFGSGSEIVFDNSKLIRLFFTQCCFDKLGGAFLSNSIVMQDIHVSQSYFKQVSDVLKSTLGIWAVGFNQCVIESGNTFIVTDVGLSGNTSQNISIYGCIVEGMTGVPLTFNGSLRGCVIDGCYFEANGTHDISVSSSGVVAVSNCYFEGVDGQGCILIPASTNGRVPCLIARNNTVAHGKLVDNTGAILQWVDVDHMRGNAFLMETDKTKNINPNAKYYISGSQDFTATANTYTNTGATISIPAYTAYEITVLAPYWTSPAKGVSVTTATTSYWQNVVGINYVDDGGNASVTITGYTDSDLILYVWAYYTGSTNNRIKYTGHYSFKMVDNGVM